MQTFLMKIKIVPSLKETRPPVSNWGTSVTCIATERSPNSWMRVMTRLRSATPNLFGKFWILEFDTKIYKKLVQNFRIWHRFLWKFEFGLIAMKMYNYSSFPSSRRSARPFSRRRSSAAIPKTKRFSVEEKLRFWAFFIKKSWKLIRFWWFW